MVTYLESGADVFTATETKQLLKGVDYLKKMSNVKLNSKAMHIPQFRMDQADRIKVTKTHIIRQENQELKKALW
ncbi:hypothetical protein [Rufibacter immobilis]|uniref:hypothetical protein n=1 Tax=Rufibacter immobilis TaxID=1348778 RepID=UPI0035EF5969